jgi:hypothetical protein
MVSCCFSHKDGLMDTTLNNMQQVIAYNIMLLIDISMGITS